MSVLAKYFICLLHFQTTALCYIYTRWHTMECKRRSALLCVPDSTWRTMECNLTQPYSWFQWWYNGMQTSLSHTLCSRHDMAYKGMYLAQPYSMFQMFQTPYGIQRNVNLIQPYSVFQTPYGVQWNVNLIQPYSVFQTPYGVQWNVNLIQPYSVFQTPYGIQWSANLLSPAL